MRWYKCRWYEARRWTRWSILTLKPARGTCKPAEKATSTCVGFGGWICCYLGCLSVRLTSSRLDWKSIWVKFGYRALPCNWAGSHTPQWSRPVKFGRKFGFVSRALGIEGKPHTEENTKRKKVNFETTKRGVVHVAVISKVHMYVYHDR